LDEICALVGAWAEGNLLNGKPMFDGLQIEETPTEYASVPRNKIKRIKTLPFVPPKSQAI